ncbi:MAG: hypothetical protein U0359_41925 [Byssovorax sp.]
MLTKLAVPLLAVAFATAPFQCARKIEPDRQIDEEPAEALYKLAEKFKAEGNAAARTETLRFIVERYPASRFAELARLDLAEPAAK